MAAPRQVAVTFIETMLAMLPEAASNWRQFQEFFSVLASFAALDSAERGYLLGRSLIGILLDFVLGKDSPHPELSGGAERITYALQQIAQGNKTEDVQHLTLVRVGGLLPCTQAEKTKREARGCGNASSHGACAQ